MNPKEERKQLKRKQRTREHIIADLSINCVEYFAIKSGFSVQRINPDYGIDLVISTYSARGEIENGELKCQVKASDSPDYSVSGKFISYPVLKQDLDYWLDDVWPVILVIYDSSKEKAYWIDIKKYIKSKRNFNFKMINETYTVRIGVEKVLNEEAMAGFQTTKNRIQTQLLKEFRE